MRILFSIYIGTLVALVLFSYGFVDPNFPYRLGGLLPAVVLEHKYLATAVYCVLLISMYFSYLSFMKKAEQKKLSAGTIWKLIGATTAILIPSYPAFSYDIFNYIATARVLFTYHENPYIVMPIELPVEPMLSFMHAANKTALYGISWVVLSGIPQGVSFGSILAAVLAFKVFIALFYLGLCFLIYNVTKKSTYALVFFALNPLVVIETLVSSHNDVVMMGFALFSFYLLTRRLYIGSVTALLFSIGVKFATGFLLPVYGYVFYRQVWGKSVPYKRVYFISALLMLGIFLLSPLREELYSWYFIWPLTFASLCSDRKVLRNGMIALSLGLLLRFAPYIATREWFGITPTIKLMVTPAPLALYLLWNKVLHR